MKCENIRKISFFAGKDNAAMLFRVWGIIFPVKLLILR